MNWQQALKDYQDYLKIERGLSGNSILNYSRDVSKLIEFLDVNEIRINPIKINQDTIK
ncbi:MAG: site-specific integrase, partial [Flavobacteriaceae bacterium]|nr:site-specific integrase [Flavobacteriaceae bacterium]